MKTSFIRISFTQTVLIFLFWTTSVCAKESAYSDSVSLQLKWLHQFQFAGYYAAELRGFYKQEGLQVMIKEGGIDSPPVENVLDEKSQYGITASEILAYRARGKPVVVLAVIFQHSPYVILTLKGRGISSPSDLAGKKLMASSEQGWAQLKAMLIREGINSSSLHISEHTWNNEDLISGKVDAMSAYITAEPFQIASLGYETVIIRPVDYGIDFYGDLIFTTEKEIRDHPERTAAFRRASIKGWEYAMSHIDEMADYIMTLPGVKERGIKKENLLYEAREMKKLILPDLIEVGHINPGRFDQMLKSYKLLGIAPRNTSTSGLIYKSEHPRNDGLLRMFSYILLLASSITLLILFWNWQLRKEVRKQTRQLQSENNHRQIAEDLARKSEERLDLALKAAQLGIWDLNLDSQIVYRNDLWTRMIGYQPEEIKPNTLGWQDLVHPDDLERINQSTLDHIAGKTLYNNYEHRLRTKSGEWKWVLALCKIVARTQNNQPSRIIGIHIDIDAIKKKEIELQNLTNELMRSNSELEEFAYMTSHNLRAPVVNMISLIDLFNKESLTNEEDGQIFDKISESVDRLRNTLDDLIEVVSTKKVGHQRKMKLQFGQILSNVLGSIESQFRKSGAKLDLNFSDAPEIVYPENVLHSIFQNLLTNSIKYSSPDRIPSISIRTYYSDDMIVLEYKDNGLGIDLKRFGSKVFGLYQRFHDSAEGKGMGLYILKSQIESLDGKIEVESEVGTGTLFRIYFR